MKEMTGEAALTFLDLLGRAASEAPDFMKDRMAWRGCTGPRMEWLAASFAALIRVTDCLIWDRPILQAALNGGEHFAERPLAAGISPDRPQLWFLNGELFRGAEDILDVPAHARCRQVLVIATAGARPDGLSEALRKGSVDRDALTGRKGICLGLIFSPVYENFQDRSLSEMMPYIRLLPTMYWGDTVPTPYASLIAACSFLALPFVDLEEEGTVSRQQRRYLERQGKRVPSIRHVILRRKKGSEEHSPASDATTAESRREYHCRWLVGAHWRKRSERWKRGEGPIFVAPYVKGPAEAEFRAPRPTVYVAKR